MSTHVFKGLAFLAATVALGSVDMAFLNRRDQFESNSSARWLFWLPGVLITSLLTIILLSASIASFTGEGPTSLR